MKSVWVLLPCLVLALAGVARAAAAGFALSSPAFAPAGRIPDRHTCEGGDESPPLRWTAPPEGTAALALVVDDPDAPGRVWAHWVLYDLPAEARELPGSVPASTELPGGGRQGKNDFRRVAYGGPCPPRGSEHRYVFTLYALDRRTGLEVGATRARLLEVIEGHVLARASLTGTFGR